MKIAIYHNLPSGGAKKALYELIARTKSNIDYDLYRIDDQENESFLDIRPFVNNIISYPLRNPYLNLPKGLMDRRIISKLNNLQKKIATDIDDKNYDAVFVNSCKYTHSPQVLRYLKTPTIYFLQEPRRSSFEYNLSPESEEYTTHGLLKVKKRLGRYILSDYLKKLDIRAVKSSNIILCNSYFSMESIARAYGEYAKVCYLGVDDKIFNLSKTEGKTDSIISVGALHPNKCHDLIIEALGSISIEPILNIVYDREVVGYKEEIQAKADRLGVKLALHNRISDEELVELYSKAKVTVCAAELEPFGFTPIESMACGTQVVAVKEGGYRETVQEPYGIFVERDPLSLAEGISSAFARSNRMNSKKISVFSQNLWTWEKAVNRYTEILELAKHESK